MQEMILEFRASKGYGNAILRGKSPELADYLQLPVVDWCVQNIGDICWPKDLHESLHGDGWVIHVEWDHWTNTVDTAPRTYVIITKPISNELVTKFWMKFQ